jgi:hypothetical protein
MREHPYGSTWYPKPEAGIPLAATLERYLYNTHEAFKDPIGIVLSRKHTEHIYNYLAYKIIAYTIGIYCYQLAQWMIYQ